MIHKLPVEHYAMIDGQRRELMNCRWEYTDEGVSFYGELEVEAGDVVESVVATPFSVTFRQELPAAWCQATMVINHFIRGSNLSVLHEER